MSRLEALTVREGKDGKSFWTKIGVAWPNKQGAGYIVRLDAMPAPVEGQFVIHLREPMQKDDRREPAKDYPNYSRATENADPFGLDDEVPGF